MKHCHRRTCSDDLMVLVAPLAGFRWEDDAIVRNADTPRFHHEMLGINPSMTERVVKSGIASFPAGNADN